MKVLAYDIDYDTDGEEVELPKEIVVEIDPKHPFSNEEEEMVSDKITEITGFCHNSFKYRHIG